MEFNPYAAPETPPVSAFIGKAGIRRLVCWLVAHFCFTLGGAIVLSAFAMSPNVDRRSFLIGSVSLGILFWIFPFRDPLFRGRRLWTIVVLGLYVGLGTLVGILLMSL